MIGGLPVIPAAGPLPEVPWLLESYKRVASLVRSLVPTLDAIERGRSDEWITVWQAPDVANAPDKSQALPCSRDLDFLARNQTDCWYFVRVSTEVAGEHRSQYFQCRARVDLDGAASITESREKADLLRSLDTQTAMATIESERAKDARSEADKWHREGLERDRKINRLEMEIERLQSRLEAAEAEQAPIVADEVADKLFDKGLSLVQLWASTPTDTGHTAKVLAASVNLMCAIQDDRAIVRLLITRHRAPFASFVNTFNEVAAAAKLPGGLSVPRLPARRKAKGA